MATATAKCGECVGRGRYDQADGVGGKWSEKCWQCQGKGTVTITGTVTVVNEAGAASTSAPTELDHLRGLVHAVLDAKLGLALAELAATRRPPPLSHRRDLVPFEVRQAREEFGEALEALRKAVS